MAINTNPGKPLRHVATFTSSGTFKVPDSTTVVFASVHGSSGGGGTGASHTRRYGGSAGAFGGAGVITSGFVQVTPGRDHVITIGAGGAAAAQGGTSTFDAAITVVGGTGGTQSVGTIGSGSAVTSLTTVPALSTALTRVFGNTTQSTGGTVGGGGGGSSSQGNGAAGSAGTSASIHVYI